MPFFVDIEMTKVLLSLVVLACAASTACATASAKAAPDRPTLEVPAPPTKVIEQTPLPEPPPEPVPDLPPLAPANPRPSKPATREAARTDPKPETTTTEAATPPVAPLSSPPQLRQPGTPEASEAAKQVQTILDRAGKALKAVNTKQFTPAKRAVYDDAHRMLTQAEEALKKSDFDNARKLAEKVELTAKELQSR
jgi:outer membrane biosynthesis protein TonB